MNNNNNNANNNDYICDKLYDDHDYDIYRGIDIYRFMCDVIMLDTARSYILYYTIVGY